MSRILLILTSILAIVGIVLGIGKRTELIEVRNSKTETNESAREVLNEIDAIVEKIEEEHTKIRDTKDELEVAQVAVDEGNRKVGQIKSQITAKTKEIEAKQARIDEIRRALEPFDGVTPENLNDRLADLEREAADKEEAVAVLQQEIEIVQSAAERKLSEMGAYNSGQRDRSAAIALQGQEAIVTAVNPDFGFAIVNAGSNRGVPEDAKIYVKRGSERVGQLKVRDLQSTLLVADILDDGGVQPGDRVIFEIKVN